MAILRLSVMLTQDHSIAEDPLESSSPLSPPGLLPYSILPIPSLGWISQCLACQWLEKPWSSSWNHRNCVISFSKDCGNWSEVKMPPNFFQAFLHHDLLKSCWPWPLRWDSHLQKSLDQKVASIFLFHMPPTSKEHLSNYSQNLLLTPLRVWYQDIQMRK